MDKRFAETLKETKAGFERMLYAMLTATVLVIVALISAPHLYGSPKSGIIIELYV